MNLKRKKLNLYSNKNLKKFNDLVKNTRINTVQFLNKLKKRIVKYLLMVRLQKKYFFKLL